MAKKITWPLAVSTFTAWDKLKISAFLFTESIWTYGKWVRAYEQMWEEKFDLKHAIMVSSGSTANELIALRRKHELQQAGEWPQKNKVIFPVNTWISSVSVWINFGFEPVFVDVEMNTLNVSSSKIKEAFERNPNIGTVFYTTLLGFFDDVCESKKITEQYGARFLLDNCESSFSYYCPRRGSHKSILKLATSSTSIFFSHLTMSGTEGGLIFTESDEEADWYRMARSHGLTRGMPDVYKNPNVNADFDFYLLGSNYRSSNLQAYMATLDFERAYNFGEKRQYLMALLNYSLSEEKYSPIFTNAETNPLCDNMFCPLAIPIVCKTKDQRIKLEQALKEDGVITRPLIGGCLLAHTAFKQYGKMEYFPIAKHLHDCAIYIGLNKDITKRKVLKLVEKLNNL